jgi:hypothetical protein
VILFIEVPLLLRICPTSAKFDGFIRKFSTNVMRAGIYLAMAAVQWLSLLGGATSLIAAAILLTLTGAFYGAAQGRVHELQDAGRAGRRADDCIGTLGRRTGWWRSEETCGSGLVTGVWERRLATAQRRIATACMLRMTTVG